MRSPRGARGERGFSLVEVLVALVLLEVALLAVLGLGVLAARTAADAAELQRAVGSLEVVADSLLEAGARGAGERLLPPHRVRWRRVAGGLRLRVERLDPPAAPLVEVVLPLAP